MNSLIQFSIFVLFINILGTCKIGQNCTSTIKVCCREEKEIIVDICLSHYGHKKQLQHTWLNKQLRQEVAFKLKSGVTPDKILDSIRFIYV